MSDNSPRPPLLLNVSRRHALGLLAVGAAALPRAVGAAPTETVAVDAIAFDGFPIFDPRSVTAVAKSLFADRGEELARAWSTKLFDYARLWCARMDGTAGRAELWCRPRHHL
ncbi:hypothetical protein BH09PSE3_BH09PSE3_05160 [soil metagenome]